MHALSRLSPEIRQYLLVTASATQPTGPGAVPTPHKGPTGLIAYALPR